MNEKSDEPAKQSVEPDQSAAQDQPQYREVSQEELKQTLEAHQRWLESDEKEGKRADLTKANLQEADLSKANLQKAYLWQANLQKAKLMEANLQGAILWQANLQKADLGQANLQKADLRQANLQETDLRGVNLQGAVLAHANLQKADLGQANLQEADFRSAKLQGANLRRVKAVTASQIKRARNWQLAFYSDDFLKELGLPADHNETLEKKLAEMEKEKEKTTTKP